jgi:hypothetical protein
MMAKVQQVDMYAWLPDDSPCSFAYDRQDHNLLEDDARVLRALWQRLVDYPNLWFVGSVAPAMRLDASHEYLLSSSKEVLANLLAHRGRRPGAGSDDGQHHRFSPGKRAYGLARLI